MRGLEDRDIQEVVDLMTISLISPRKRSLVDVADVLKVPVIVDAEVFIRRHFGVVYVGLV